MINCYQYFLKFINKVIINGKKQYHFVLGESGTGKSSFLINLCYRYDSKMFRHNYNIKYMSLKFSDVIDKIDKIDNKKQTILLLDAFDEAKKANHDANIFLKEIEESTINFAKIIITSRNNFFDNDESLPQNIHITRTLKLETEKYNIFYIDSLSILNIIFYIIRKYRLFFWRTLKAFDMIRKCGNIVCRPLVIGYIDLLIQDTKRYKTMYDIYEGIIENWIKRESYYVASQIKSETSGSIYRQIYSLINKVTIFMYENFPKQNDYYIKISELYMMDFSGFLIKTNGKRGRSLFDRIDERLYFSHKSIFEYLLAINFCKLNFRYEANLNILYEFLKEMGRKNPQYQAMFQINYIEDNFEILPIDSDTMRCTKRFLNIDRKFVEPMIYWYDQAFFSPVFIGNLLYERKYIEFIVNDTIHFELNKGNNDIITLSVNIMKLIKNNISNQKEAVIRVNTLLKLKI